MEVTRLAETLKKKDGRTSVRAAYLFDIPKGSVAYIGSFDIEASALPVEITVVKDIESAQAAAVAAGIDHSRIQVLERNLIRGMEKLVSDAQSGS